MPMINWINNYFSEKEKIKRAKLREIDNRIAIEDDYNELVKLTRLYNRIKQDEENQTN
jgi:hypothetical protein